MYSQYVDNSRSRGLLHIVIRWFSPSKGGERKYTVSDFAIVAAVTLALAVAITSAFGVPRRQQINLMLGICALLVVGLCANVYVTMHPERARDVMHYTPYVALTIMTFAVIVPFAMFIYRRWSEKPPWRRRRRRPTRRSHGGRHAA